MELSEVEETNIMLFTDSHNGLQFGLVSPHDSENPCNDYQPIPGGYVICPARDFS